MGRVQSVLPGSTDVPLQHRDQRAEIATALGRVFDVFDAVVGVRVNDFLAEGFESAARRNDLVQNVSAIGVFGHQPFDGLDLAANLSQAGDERVFLVLRVHVSHGPYLRQNLRNAKTKITVDAEGGRGYSLRLVFGRPPPVCGQTVTG